MEQNTLGLISPSLITKFTSGGTVFPHRRHSDFHGEVLFLNSSSGRKPPFDFTSDEFRRKATMDC